MERHERGQVENSAAEVYERLFVPALFAQWAERVARRADLSPGQRVLDVACGSGVLARAVADCVAAGGSVTGVDVNPGMLAVARRADPRVEWKKGAAEALPFEDSVFDRVVSQFGLMFFEDRGQALGEMRRVVRPPGSVTVAVWGPLEDTPGYAAAAELLRDVFGPEAAESLRAPYDLGDPDELTRLFEAAGFDETAVDTEAGTVRFPSLKTWMTADIRGWTLAGSIDDAGFARLLGEAEKRLSRFVQDDGSVVFPTTACIVSARG